MDWVDRPRNYKGLYWNFATFARLIDIIQKTVD